MAVVETDVVATASAPPEAGEASMGRRLLAEFVGTMLFVAIGTGAATVLLLGPVNALGGLPEAAQGDQVLQALVQSTFGDVLVVALAFAFGLAALVYAFGGVSGAHFNPAVTFALAVARRFKWGEVPLYWLVQILGGIAGAFIIAGIYGQMDPSGAQVLYGATTVAENVNEAQALLAEAFLTFVLVTAIMGIAVDPRAPKGWSGLVIGIALGAGILATAHATGGSANFARSLGPFIAALPYEEAPNIPWKDLIIYAAGPLIGGAAAALVYESVTGLEQHSPAPHPGAATPTTPDRLHEGEHGGAAGTVQTHVVEVHDEDPPRAL